MRPDGTVHSSALYFPSHVRRQTSIDRGALLFRENEYDFAIVTDLDLASRDPQKFDAVRPPGDENGEGLYLAHSLPRNGPIRQTHLLE